MVNVAARTWTTFPGIDMPQWKKLFIYVTVVHVWSLSKARRNNE